MTESSQRNPVVAWPRLLVVGSFLPGCKLERYAGGNLAVEVMKAGGSVIATSPRRWQSLRLADMLWTTLLRRKDYDVAHITVFSGRAFIYAECITTLLSVLRKPCTLGLHGGNLPDFASRHPERVNQLLQRAACVVCPSRYLFEKMKPFRADIHLIPNGVPVARYPINSRPSDGPRLLWLRAFHQIYNPMMAPAVLARLRVNMPQARLTMVGPDKGDGSYAATRKIATQLGVLNHIKFTGSIPKEAVAQVLGEHDIFLNTTNVDNTPVSVIEAMACGLPVVSTNVGGIPYLLEHGETALLVQPGNVEEMTAAVTQLVTDPHLATQLRANGRKLAESFDWDVVLPQWQRLLNGVMPARPLSNALRLA